MKGVEERGAETCTDLSFHPASLKRATSSRSPTGSVASDSRDRPWQVAITSAHNAGNAHWEVVPGRDGALDDDGKSEISTRFTGVGEGACTDWTKDEGVMYAP